MLRAPEFWNHASGPAAAPLARALLEPVSWLYQAGANVQANAIRAAHPGAPVICIGNLTLGGAGKTPVALAILERLQAQDITVHALSRGYGGRLRGPITVDEAVHTFRDVGDEALLLSRKAPTWVAKNKVAGARAAVQAGADVVVLDDGFQNRSIAKDLSLVVIDADSGLGNGRVFPAGPLRENAARGLERADAIVLLGADLDTQAHSQWRALTPAHVPILTAHVAPRGPIPLGPIFAFAGIARPQKFFDGLRAAGAELKATATYPDHHPFSGPDLVALRENARRHNAHLITTEKDHVRLPRQMRRIVHAWPVAAEFHEPAKLDALIDSALDRSAIRR